MLAASITIICRPPTNVRVCGEKMSKSPTPRRETFSLFQKISPKPLDKSPSMVYNICVRGYSLMVKLQLPKLAMRVRFPLLAPKGKGRQAVPFLLATNGRKNPLQDAGDYWALICSSAPRRNGMHLATERCVQREEGFRFPLLAPKGKGRQAVPFLLATNGRKNPFLTPPSGVRNAPLTTSTHPCYNTFILPRKGNNP